MYQKTDISAITYYINQFGAPISKGKVKLINILLLYVTSDGKKSISACIHETAKKYEINPASIRSGVALYLKNGRQKYGCSWEWQNLLNVYAPLSPQEEIRAICEGYDDFFTKYFCESSPEKLPTHIRQLYI